jgi:hypothetical protein
VFFERASAPSRLETVPSWSIADSPYLATRPS